MTEPKQAKREVTAPDAGAASELLAGPVPRFDSQVLFRQGREIEIAHAGRIYRLRLTQLNKLILTA